MGIRVIIINLVPLLSKVTRDILASDPRVSSVEIAESFSCAIDLIRRSGPHIAVFDPGRAGFREASDMIDTFERLGSEKKLLRTIALTDRNEPGLIIQCISHGVDSYLHKSITPAELVDTVVDTWRGGRTWRVEENRPKERAVIKPSASLLSRREQEVFTLILQRMSNEEIAERLMLAHQTVKNHVSSVLQKLGLQSRKQLIRQYNGRATVLG